MELEGLYLPGWRTTCIDRSASLKDALAAINRSGALMACVVDTNGSLLGIITDSDVRRALLGSAGLNEGVEKWLRLNPITGPAGATPEELLALASKRRIRELPLVDTNGHLADIFVLVTHQSRISTNRDESRTTIALPNPMLVMAGGLGTRLRSVVSDRPKPLALVGGRPIIETLLRRAADAGIRKVYVAVNYLAEQIEEHLRSEIYRDLDIQIIREKQRLGTAGAVGLIKDKLEAPMIITNADVLTTVPFEQLILAHDANRADITCTVRPYKVSIPFGVFEVKNDRISGIREKPDTSFLVNAGIYVLNPEICRKVQPDTALDMPTLIETCLQEKRKVSPFLMHEYWIDVGQPDDFHRANEEFKTVFGDKDQ